MENWLLERNVMPILRSPPPDANAPTGGEVNGTPQREQLHGSRIDEVGDEFIPLAQPAQGA